MPLVYLVLEYHNKRAHYPDRVKEFETRDEAKMYVHNTYYSNKTKETVVVFGEGIWYFIFSVMTGLPVYLVSVVPFYRQATEE